MEERVWYGSSRGFLESLFEGQTLKCTARQRAESSSDTMTADGKPGSFLSHLSLRTSGHVTNHRELGSLNCPLVFSSWDQVLGFHASVLQNTF